MTTQLREDGPSETSRGRAEDGVAVRRSGTCRISGLEGSRRRVWITRPRVPHSQDGLHRPRLLEEACNTGSLTVASMCSIAVFALP